MPVVREERETAGQACTRLFVSNLSPTCTSAQLREHFSSNTAAGFLLTDVQVIRKQGSGSSSRCIGFVGFSNPEDASAARKYFNGSYLGPGRLNITFARDSEQRRVSPSSFHPNVPPTPGEIVKSTKLNRRTQALKSDLEAALAPRCAHAWSNDDEVKAVNQSAKRKCRKMVGSASPEFGEPMNCTAKQGKRTETSILLESDDSDLQWLREKSLNSRPPQQQVGKKSRMGEASPLEEDDRAGMGVRADTNNMVEKKMKKSGVDAYSEARLYLKNIPFSCGHDDLKDILSFYGRVTELHIPKNDRGDDRGNRGYAFAQVSSPVEACAAAESLNGSTFQGRVLHVIPARGPLKYASSSSLEPSVSTVRGKAGRLKRMGHTEQAGEEAWMPSHIRGEAAATAVARKLGIGKADLLGIKDEVTGGKGDSTAVRQALAETDVIAENQRYFAENGVDISVALGDDVAGDKAKRSDQVIIVKNLVPSILLEDLMKLFGAYGDVTRLLLPPSRSMALVEFSLAKDASKAFKKLAYRRVVHVPLYLEWARQGAMLACKGDAEDGSVQKGTLEKDMKHQRAKETELSAIVEEEEGDIIDEENDIAKNPITLFVKGLSFSTTEAALRKRCEELLNMDAKSSVRMVTIPQCPVKLGANRLASSCTSTEGRSAGYGFVEFRTPQMAALACQALNGAILDGHTLQASPKEVKELFEAYGAVKTLRMPRMRVAGMGMRHRGFAFVELLSVGEAKRAMKALSGTHLYGRHLVLEWAEEDNSVQGLREKAQRDISSDPTSNAIPKRLNVKN